MAYGIGNWKKEEEEKANEEYMYCFSLAISDLHEENSA